MPHRLAARRHCLRLLTLCASGPVWPAWAQASSDGEVLIGQSVQLSGPTSRSIGPVIDGQRLAIDEFNRKGGVGGRPVRLITLDDAYEVERCVVNVRKLVDEHKVIAMYGLGSAANVSAVLPFLTERQVPLVGIYTGAPSLREKHHPYLFTTMSSYRDELDKMMQNLVSLKLTRVGLAVLDNSFGQQMEPEAQSVAKQHGIHLVTVGRVDLTGSNAKAVAQTMGKSQPQALIAMVFGQSFVPFVRAARVDINAPIYVPSIANSKADIDALGSDARGMAITQSLPNALRPTSPLTRDYATVMARAGRTVDFDHFYGYLNIRILLEGLRRAGRGVSSASLVNALQRMGRVDLGGYSVNFTPQNHHGSRFVELSVLGPNGRYIR